jgi:hypothetical protein
VLAASDAEQREKFLSFVCRHRAPRISAHWTFLLAPLVLDHAEEKGPIRYRQIEYYRMPVMAYLALDNPRTLTRGDFIRLGLVTAPGGDETLPYSDRHVAGFEERYCYDRFWSEGVESLNTRYMCCGHALIVVGDARSPFFTDRETGVLAQFRHQHFLLFLIPHFQKAALLMFASRLVNALKNLEIGDPESVKQFKRAIRQNFEIFLRFTHRYWFHEIADQAQARRSSPWSPGIRPRPAVPGGEGAHVRHERVPRQRQPAPSGEHRGPADRGDHVRHDRHDHHRLLRHEHARGDLVGRRLRVLYRLLFFVVILVATSCCWCSPCRGQALGFLGCAVTIGCPSSRRSSFWRVWVSEAESEGLVHLAKLRHTADGPPGATNRRCHPGVNRRTR